jgi:FdhD protein
MTRCNVVKRVRGSRSAAPQNAPEPFAIEPARIVERQIWRESGLSLGRRSIPEETAVALTYNGGTYAVMMATPRDLEDFAVGFSLDEGIVSSKAEIESFDIVRLDDGIELRMWLDQPNAARLQRRRRHIAGPTGCGLCGIESVAEALLPAAAAGGGRNFSPRQVMMAIRNMPLLQKLNAETRAVHAAAFWDAANDIVALREDVGRHNALDKLSGALARASLVASDGIVLLTSRVSVEMVQKCAAIGALVVVSVSAPTALAVRTAEESGITLAAIARADGFEVFTHPHRISFAGIAAVESDADAGIHTADRGRRDGSNDRTAACCKPRERSRRSEGRKNDGLDLPKMLMVVCCG